MFLAEIAFYLFSAVLLLSATMVVVAKNPVHSVLFLILAFFNAAGLFVLLGAEFVAMILVIVYVGAVAVLFLFVVMMLNIDAAALRAGFARYLPVGALVGLVLFLQITFMISSSIVDPSSLTIQPQLPVPPAAEVENTRALGQVLYTHYAYAFQLSGLILLVAMIGAIVLTLRERDPRVRRQNQNEQIERKASAALELQTPASGEGIKL